MTPQQERIVAEVRALLSTLDEVVPETTSHYAVEDVRRSLRVLTHQAGRVITRDVKADA